LAAVGDPALGPVGFPHRDSASEIPQAPLGHHFEDSTHISSDVITAGVSFRALRIEASAFHGAEPDEKRWDLDGGKLDSESLRLGVGGNYTWYRFPAILSGFYGERPRTRVLYVRARLGA